MTHQQIVSAAQKFGFEYHEDTTGHYHLLAPGIRIRGVVGQKNASSGSYSQAVSSTNPLYLHTQVIVDLLNGENLQDMIDTGANAWRQDVIREIASI